MKNMKVSRVPDQDSVRTYDIWLADIPAMAGSHIQFGRRPVIILSNDMANRCSPVVSVVPLTSNLNKRHLPTHVYLRESGLSRPSVALCEQITSLDKRALVHRIGSVESAFSRAALRHCVAVQLSLIA